MSRCRNGRAFRVLFFFTHDDKLDFIQFLCIYILRLTCVSFNNISVNRLKFPFFSFEPLKSDLKKRKNKNKTKNLTLTLW